MESPAEHKQLQQRPLRHSFITLLAASSIAGLSLFLPLLRARCVSLSFLVVQSVAHALRRYIYCVHHRHACTLAGRKTQNKYIHDKIFAGRWLFFVTFANLTFFPTTALLRIRFAHKVLPLALSLNPRSETQTHEDQHITPARFLHFI